MAQTPQEGWDLPEVVSGPTTAVPAGLEPVHTADDAFHKSIGGPEVQSNSWKRVSGGKEVFTGQTPPSEYYANNKFPAPPGAGMGGERQQSEQTLPSKEAGKPPFWTKRRIWIAAAVAVVIVIAVVVGAVVGTLVGNQSDSVDDDDSSSDSSEEPTSTATSSSPFGTPTSFANSFEPSDSACSGEICAQTLVSIDTPGSDDDSALMLFALGAEGDYWVREADEDGWKGDWESLGGGFKSQPAVVATTNGRLDIFGVDDDMIMMHKSYRMGTWDSTWANLGGQCFAPPAACGFEDGTIIVFTVSSDNRLAVRRLRDGLWTPPLSEVWNRHLTGFIASSPQTACIDGDVTVVAYGDKSAGPYEVMIKRGNGTRLDYWRTRGGDFQGDPSLFSASNETLEVFGFGAADGSLYHGTWQGWNTTQLDSSSGEPEKVEGDLMSVPTVIRNHHDQLDVLAVGQDGRLKRAALVDSTLDDEWEDLGGFFQSAPLARLTANSTVSVFGIGPEKTIVHGRWTVNDDHSWSDGQWFDDGGNFSTSWYRTGPA